MSTIALQRVRAVRTLSGAKPAQRHFPEAASQSATKAGAFVYLVSGLVTICANNSQTIMGLLEHNCSGTTNKDCIVTLATADTVFEGNIYHQATVASSITAQSQVGENYGIELVGTTRFYVALDEVSTIAVRVIGLSKKDVVGDLYGRVQFVVIPLYSQVYNAG